MLGVLCFGLALQTDDVAVQPQFAAGIKEAIDDLAPRYAIPGFRGNI